MASRNALLAFKPAQIPDVVAASEQLPWVSVQEDVTETVTEFPSQSVYAPLLVDEEVTVQSNFLFSIFSLESFAKLKQLVINKRAIRMVLISDIRFFKSCQASICKVVIIIVFNLKIS